MSNIQRYYTENEELDTGMKNLFDHSRDSELLADLKAGLPEAVQIWYQHYRPRLQAFIKPKVAVETDADEVVQDIFLACLKHLPLFRGESSIWTWMVRIAQHEIADYYRKRYAKKFIHALPLSELFPISPVQDAHETSQRVTQILHRMKAESREILLMKYVDQKQVRQIAVELGKSMKAVESLLFRARIEFRELYIAGE